MGSEMILLDQTIIEDIRRHGEEEYPHECCGMLLGTLQPDHVKKITERLPLSNAREDGARHNRFFISPLEFMKCERIALGKQLDILGIYHSHPDHPAAPSEYDREHALPFYSYIIVSVLNAKAEDITSWILKDDRSSFFPESILNGE
jgi:proteasome lid subunit RPN8/RPN11